MNPQQRAALKEKVAARNASNSKPSPIQTVERPAKRQEAVIVAADPVAKPEKPVKEKGPTLTHNCGHVTAISHYEHRACGECRNERQKAKREKNKAKIDARRAAQAACGAPEIQAAVGRLPDGADYHKVYDSARCLWTGTLIVTVAGTLTTFRAEASGSYGVEKLLDSQYRESVEKASAEVPV